MLCRRCATTALLARRRHVRAAASTAMGVGDSAPLPRSSTAAPPPPSLVLVLRQLDIFSTAARAFADYKLTSWRADQQTDAAAAGALWDAAHERNAALLARTFLRLEGLWVKLGQYLSSRADVMPAAYLRALARCQDALPPPPWAETAATLQSELGRPLAAVFTSVERTPLAVASIASVHRATLLDGSPVVVKVQHARVRARLLLDLRCLEAIGRIIRWLDPDLDLSPVVREWAREVPKELDFVNEAANTAAVARNLAPLALLPPGDERAVRVRVARVVPGLTSGRLLVLSFVDGFKVNDTTRLDAAGVDRAHVVGQVTRAYAQMIFGDGFYSGDPHPGNILLDAADGHTPVLIDFGLVKALAADERRHFARLIVAAAEGDVHTLLASLEGVGLRLRPGVPFDFSLLGAYFFRPANPAFEEQEEHRARRERWRAEAEEKGRTLYEGDRVTHTTAGVLGWRSSRTGEVVSLLGDVGDGGDAGCAQRLLLRLADGREVAVEVADCALLRSRSPIDAWPDAFIFFERSLNLLRGLTAQLGVRQSYLEVMTPFARAALRSSPAGHSRPGDGPGGGGVRGADSLGLAPLLRAALAGGEALGCQVSVRRNGAVLCELSAGDADPYEGRPVGPATLFCAFSVTKGLAAACVHALAQRGLVDLESPVAAYWPAFGGQGKAAITVSDVLTHRSGLADAGSAELAADPLLCADSGAMLRLVAAATPDPGALGRVVYHALSFGWILDGLVRAVTGGVPLRDFAAAEFARPLGIEAEFGVGVPGAPRAGVDAGDGDPPATLVLSRTPEAAAAAAAAARRGAAAPAAPAPAGAGSRPGAPPPVPPPPPPGPGPRRASAGRRPPSAPSLLANPTYFNTPAVRSASLPSANGHFSARALTLFYDDLSRRRGLGDRLLRLRAAGGAAAWGPTAPAAAASSASVGAGGGAPAVLQGGERSFLGGFVHCPSPGDGDSVLTFGHSGLGGSWALCRHDAATGDAVSVAVLVNRLSPDARLTRRLVRAAFTALRLPVPDAFATE